MTLTALDPGTAAPPIPGVAMGEGPRALFFYKVTCPVCQMAAPKVQSFEEAYPGLITGVGQDPEAKLGAFAREHGMTFPQRSDEPPYSVSMAYGIRVVPTLFVVDADGIIVSSTESWDREGLNAGSRKLAELAGLPYRSISEPGDGLSPFRPG
jgi:peroxiredoxin